VKIVCSKPCTLCFIDVHVRRHRFMEMNKEEQDIVLLALIQAGRQVLGLESAYASRTQKKKSRAKNKDNTLQVYGMTYHFLSLQVCRSFFFFIHEIGRTRYRNLLEHYKANGLSLRMHKSTGKVPKRHNILTAEDRIRVEKFIKNHADMYGLPLPGRLPYCKDLKAVKLPSAESKARVYRKYCEAIDATSGARKVGETSFRNIWREHLPHISCQKPADDLCDVCRQNVLRIQRAANSDDAAKDEALKEAVEHLERAKTQRKYYNEWRRKAAEEYETTYQDVSGKFNVLSFDFAGQIHYPSSPQQVGPGYFKTARKCGIFGVHDERTHIQENYLIDEDDNVGKGANVVISLLHDYLERNVADGSILILFADDCVEQNKNNVVLQYLNWRLLTGKNSLIELNFMMVGHIKFSKDCNFGLLKLLYGKSDIDCFLDFIRCVEASSCNGFNKARPMVDPVTNERNVNWSQWTSFLDQFFRHIPGITRYYHFLFSEDGSLKARLFADHDFEIVQLLTTPLDVIEAEMIEDIIPKNMSDERKWYLFTEIRQLCISEEKKDLLAPKPLGCQKPYPKKQKRKDHEEEHDADVDEPSAPKKQHTPRKRAKSRAQPKQVDV